MFYSVDQAKMNSVFSVPNDLVDKHIRLANENQIKVLLLILRNNGKTEDIDSMSKALKISKDDINDCLQYWILTGMIKQSDFSTIEEPVKFIPASRAEVKKAENTIKPSKPTSSEIAQRIDESPEIGHLMVAAQGKLGRTIGYDGQGTLLLLHDHYGLPIEVLFMLIEYCVSIGKTSNSYIESVGMDWGIKEIDTLEKAAAKIASLNCANNFWPVFAEHAGITTPKPTLPQTEYLSIWKSEWKFSDEMIFRAYDIAAEKTGKISFGYTNKVLKNWHEEGFKNLSDVEENQKKRTEVFKPNETGTSYDFDEFKNRSIHGELKYERKKKE